MVDLSFSDMADIASYLMRFCCCYMCGGCDDEKADDYQFLGGLYCFRIFIGLILISIEFGTENGVFVKEYNQTIPDAFNDGLISANSYNSFIVIIVTIIVLFLAIVVHVLLLCNRNKSDNTEDMYWLMTFVYKIISFVLDFSMFLFTVFLALSIGDTVVDFSTEGLTALLSLLFFLKLIDMVLDFFFILKTCFTKLDVG